jgi:hypothetical protein
VAAPVLLGAIRADRNLINVLRRLQRTTFVLAALGGCNQIFDITTTEVIASTDTDDDGLLDQEDNCPAAANLDQADFDTDGVGDACDNCPLYANTPQDNEGEPDGERDEIGDDCDPNPTVGGDCLILLDKFSSAAQLATNWELVYGAGDAVPSLDQVGDHVVLAPHATNKPAFMIARVDGARLVGRFSVNALGNWSPSGDFAEAMAASDVTSPDLHLACGLQKLTGAEAAPFIRFQVGTMSQIQGGFMSGAPVRSDVLIRLIVERRAMDVGRCSVELGVADGVTNTANFLAPLPAGGAGIVATNEPMSIRAVALYETRAGCPAAIVR